MTRDVKEETYGNSSNLEQSRMNHYNLHIGDMVTFKRSEIPRESFKLLNTLRKYIWREVISMDDIPSLAFNSYIMGLEPSRWCRFHKVKGHHT